MPIRFISALPYVDLDLAQISSSHPWAAEEPGDQWPSGRPATTGIQSEGFLLAHLVKQKEKDELLIATAERNVQHVAMKDNMFECLSEW